MVTKTTKRKFPKVKKTKSGVPLKYLAGLTGEKRKRREKEILKAKQQYKSGSLTRTSMNRLAKSRAKDASKKKK
jgi:transcriptional regulator of met regulon